MKIETEEELWAAFRESFGCTSERYAEIHEAELSYFEKHDRKSSLLQSEWRTIKPAILKKFDYTCQHCGLRDKDVMEVDHKIPVSSGGALFDEDNLWTLCANCHRRKTNAEKKLWFEASK